MKGVKSMLALNKMFNPLSRNSLLESYIEGILNNNRESLILLYEDTKEAVYGYVLSLLKNKHDAEDAFQEVYIKIHENASKYRRDTKPLAWILTIARNICFDRLRKNKDTYDIYEMYDLGFLDKNHKNVEDKIILEIAFNKITDEERNIVMLYVVSGLKHKEIAKLLSIPLSTVLSKYNRAMKKMRDILKEDMK